MAISGLASTQPKTVMLSLFKIAVRVKHYKDRGHAASAHSMPGKVVAGIALRAALTQHSRGRDMLAAS